MQGTSRRQWLGFGLFVVVLASAIVIAVGYLVFTVVSTSCGSC